MKILIGNTGRGGELAILTSFLEAYKKALPDAYIEVMTADNGIYGPIFENYLGIVWKPLDFRDKSKSYYLKPVDCWWYHAKRSENEFDHIEFICEYGQQPSQTVLANLYQRIKKPFFGLEDIPRRVVMYPTQEECDWADRLHDDYPLLAVISHVCKSATLAFRQEDYQALANRLREEGYSVAYTGGLSDSKLEGHMDLRGISFRKLYALSQRLKFFVGPDTATTWIVTNMPGKLICLRGCRRYPPQNTGLLANAFRRSENTLEWDIIHKPRQLVIDGVVRIFKYNDTRLLNQQ